MKTLHRAWLAVPPLLGLLAIGWAGANRPEKKIVGKWQTGGEDETIELRADGSYERHGWQMIYECRQVSPEGTTPTRFEDVPTTKGRSRSWGRFTFVARDRLVLDEAGREVNGRPPLQHHPSHQVWICGTARLSYLTFGEKAVIGSDEARVGDEVWKRIE